MPRLILVLFSALAILAACHAQPVADDCHRTRMLHQLLSTRHFSPPAFNAATNNDIVDLFIREADSRNLIFLQSDVEEIKRISEKVPAPDVFCLFQQTAIGIATRRIKQVDSILAVKATAGFSFTVADTLTFMPARSVRRICEDVSELSSRIEKRLKYDCIRYMIEANVQDRMHLLLTSNDVEKAEHDAFRKSLKSFRQYLVAFRNQDRLITRFSDAMCRAMARRCDPHSTYFSASTFGEYNASLSAEQTSFGFRVEVNDSGAVILSEIVAGSTLAKSESLKAGDQIVAVTFEDGKKVCVDSCDAEALVAELQAGVHTQVTLEVKTDDKLKEIRIDAEQKVSDANAIRGYLMRVGPMKLGYIPVPTFYTGEQGCAWEVTREVIRLMQDSISGLLLDLRFNGGGSMREAIALAGIFIDEGPVALYRPPSGEPFPLKDLHRGTVWDGPLLVLVNAASASASEFFSAAMQDHHRAVIAGSTTYGKGTAQSVVPLDTGSVYSEEGYVKLTAGKFYRITGEGVQCRGVAPDVPLPGITGQLVESEEDQPFRISGDSLPPRYTVRGAKLPVELLRVRSRERQDANPMFSRLKFFTDTVEYLAGIPEKVSLSLYDIHAYAHRQTTQQTRLTSLLGSAQTEIVVEPVQQHVSLLKMRNIPAASLEETLKLIGKDLVLGESLEILADLVRLTAPK